MTAAANPPTLLQRRQQNTNSLPLFQALCNQFQSNASGQSLSNSGHPEPANKSEGRYAARALLSEQTREKQRLLTPQPGQTNQNSWRFSTPLYSNLLPALSPRKAYNSGFSWEPRRCFLSFVLVVFNDVFQVNLPVRINTSQHTWWTPDTEKTRWMEETERWGLIWDDTETLMLLNLMECVCIAIVV